MNASAPLRRIVSGAILALAMQPCLRAAAVTINSNTQIAIGDTAYDGSDLIVDGATLTIDGRHSLASLTLSNGAIVTHLPTSNPGFEGIDLEITGTLAIGAGSAIDVTGKGYPQDRTVGNTSTGAATGNSGGSHGGLGRRGNGTSEKGRVYGDFRDPQFPGAGGGSSSYGGVGGGLVRIKAASATLDGSITADGTNGWYNFFGAGGGGAGGGIRLEIDSISGSGTVSAKGGSNGGGSGGGGGRIAVLYQDLAGFSFDQISAVGGTGGIGAGSAGTIWTREGTSEGHLWIADRGTTLGEFTPLGLGSEATVDVENLHVDGPSAKAGPGGSEKITALSIELINGGKLIHQSTTGSTEYDLTIEVTGTTTIDQLSAIDLDGAGYLPGYTEGNNTSDASTATAGGSHGGLGHENSFSVANRSYGDFRMPRSLGAGGANPNRGAPGGGRVKLTTDTLIIDGKITANGKTGQGNIFGSGGSGAGGSVLITAREIQGSGTISANGGNGFTGVEGGSESGGGGRIALYYTTLTGFDLTQVQAIGGFGSGTVAGGTGTVFLSPQGQNSTLLVDDRGQLQQAFTPLGTEGDTGIDADHLVVRGDSAIVVPAFNAPIMAGSVTLENGGRISHLPNTETEVFALDLRVAGNLSIDATSSIEVTGKGYLPGRTNGNSLAGGSVGRAGGSHGGAGVETFGHITNLLYGDARFPTLPGAGAGIFENKSGAGGGVIRIEAHSAMVDGAIRADGAAGWGNFFGSGGGGAGGSIAINAGTISGAGAISANGGDGGGTDGGNGGGGRVAVHYWDTLAIPETSITANGGAKAGGDGGMGSVIVSNTPYLHWLETDPLYAHGTTGLEAVALAMDPAKINLRLDLTADERTTLLQAGAPSTEFTWNTTAVADGWYVLRGTLLGMGGATLTSSSLPALVQNSATWHTGTVSANESWSSGGVHIVEDPLIVADGVTLAIDHGAVVKFVPGSRIQVQPGGTLDIDTQDTSKAVLTSLLDDTAGGDTNLDGSATIPVAGDWSGFAVEDGGTLNLSAFAQVRYLSQRHRGTLAGNETWLADTVHMVDANIEVPSGVTLTILPGAVVKIPAAGEINIRSGGKLNAHGTQAKPIIFTSQEDDAHGGDTNRNISQTSPQAGDWRWIFCDNGEADLTNVHILYAGKPSGGGWDTTGALRVTGTGSAALTNGIIRDAFWDGALAYPGGTIDLTNTVIARCDRGVNSDTSAQVTLLNCTVDANRIGIWGHGGAIQLTNTIVSHSIEAGLDNILNSPITMANCDVWSATGANYARMADQTGTNGNFSVDPKYADPLRRHWRLAFASPVIDAADGTAAPSTDIAGAPRFDDPRVDNTGTPAAGGAFADLGAYEFVENADSDIDLQVVAVSGPIAATAGDTVNISWTIRNLGTATAYGPWLDKIGLALADGTWIPVAEHWTATAGSLGAGQTRTETATITVAGSTPGTYHWAVQINAQGSVFEGRHQKNNTQPAAESVALSIRELVVGGATISGTFTASINETWLHVGPDLTEDSLVTVEFAGAASRPRIWASATIMPTPASHELGTRLAGPAIGLTCPSSNGQTWYLRIRGEGLSDNESTPYTIRATEAQFAANAIEPTRAGTAGPVTFKVLGSGLAPNTICELIGSGGTLSTSAVFFENSTRIYPTFDLRNAAPGTYSLRLGGVGSGQTLTDAVTVVSDSPGRVEAEVVTPPALRAGTPASVDVVYRNTGDTDVPAPLLGLTIIGGAFEPWLGQRNVMMVLGISPDGPAGILRAGTEHWISLPLASADSASGVDINLHGAGISNMSIPIPWSAMKTVLRPDFVTDRAWDLIWSNLQSRVGSTLHDLNLALAEAATNLSAYGARTQDAQRLLATLLSSAGLEPIENRQSMGVFGQSRWADWQIFAPEGPQNGNITIRRGYNMRLFRHVQTNFRRVPDELNGGFRIVRNPYDGYEAPPGDPATLVKNGDGTLVLTEPDGSIITFGTDGNWTSIADGLGRIVTATYAAGRLTTINYPDGEQVNVTYNAQGLVSSVDAPSGGTVNYTYDATGRYLASASGREGTVNFDYSPTADGSENAPEAIEFPDGSNMYFDYDDQGRLTGVATDGGLGAVTYEYPSDGRAIIRDGQGTPVEVAWTQHGKPGRIKAQSGESLTFEYDENGRPTTIDGPDGAWFRYQFDANGRLTAVTDGNGGTRRFSYTTDSEIENIWDANGNLTAIVRPAPGTVDQLRVDNTKTRYVFDSLDRMTSRTDRRGQTTDYVWSAEGVLTEINRPTNGTTTLIHDDHSRVTQSTGPGGTIATTYDDNDRVTRIDYPKGRWVAYTYGPGGRRESLTTSAGKELVFVHDSLGRLSALEDGAGDRILECSFDDAGRITEKRYGNGTVETFAFHPEGYVDSVIVRGPGGNILNEINYTWDAGGRVATRKGTDGDWTYAYDAAGQLTRAAETGGSTHAYAYDAAGNRTSASVDGVATHYSVNHLNQYTIAGGRTLDYDDNGNLTIMTGPGGSYAFSYDDEDQLVAATTPIATWNFEYDSMGNLSASVRDGVRTEYLFDALGSALLAEYDAAGNLQSFFAGGFGPVMREDGTGTRSYYGHDLIGNVAFVADATGAIAHRHVYAPFGAETSTPGGVDLHRMGGRFGMITFEEDLIFVRQRFYSASLGRFLQEDQLFPNGTNLYAYAANDPINHTDVDGKADVNPVIDELLYMLSKAKDHRDGNLNRVEELIAKGLGVTGGALDWFANMRLDQISRSEAIRLQARLAQWIQGNPMRARELNRLADHLKNAAGSERITHIAKGAATWLGRALKGYAIVKSLKDSYTSVQKWREGKQHWSDTLCDLGKAVGSVWGAFNPLLGAVFTGWDLATDWAFNKWFDATQPAAPTLGTRIGVVGSFDPNDILGPAGAGDGQWVAPGTLMAYRIRFENDAEKASAPAQTVTVTHALDAHLDWDSFELGEVGFGDHVVPIPSGLREHCTRVDLRPTADIIVDITVTFSDEDGTVTWKFTSLDPETNWLTLDPLAGFLPPNKTKPEGEGYVTFHVRAREDVTQGSIEAEASIVFDLNDAIETNVFVNNIDGTAPSASITTLAEKVPGGAFDVSWAGLDSESGIAGYTVHVSTDGGPFSVWLSNTSLTESEYAGAIGHSYRFIAQAVDRTGNSQPLAASAQATTTTVTPGRLVNISSRGAVGSGDNIMVPGFVVEDGAREVLVRGVGPSLSAFLSGYLPDPTMRVLNGSVSIAENDDWKDAPNLAAMTAATEAVGAFPLENQSGDACSLLTLNPGTFTVHVADAGTGSGITLVEVYDAGDAGDSAQLVNISTRAQVGTGGDILISGFVTQGEFPCTLVIRAAGPTLAQWVNGTLEDPIMILFKGSDEIQRNDDWGDAANAEELAAAMDSVGAFEFSAGSKDSAMLVTLEAGSYTVHALGAGDTTGIALIEIYLVRN